MAHRIRIVNGRIWDGTSFTEGDVTVDVETGKVLAMGDRVPEVDYVYDAEGDIVSPGLVDIHMHLQGISTDRFGVQAESACFPFGVTAAADCGAEQYGRKRLEDMAVKNAVFVCTQIRQNQADLSMTEELLEEYREKAVGVKVYLDTLTTDVRDVSPLLDICRFAQERKLKVMVHCTRSPVSMSEISEVLNPGDILTHVYHGGVHNAAEDGFEALKAAKERGVILDSGTAGNVHTDFAVMEQGIWAGVTPNTISSDVTKGSVYMRGGVYGLTMCMSMFRSLGMGEEEIFRGVTSAAGEALGQSCWGRLLVGADADLAVIRYGRQPYRLIDENGKMLQDEYGYYCRMTLSNGQVMYRSGRA